jgi:phospholipid/cholesterol/gamma-HCH transport system substrate-binding protein
VKRAIKTHFKDFLAIAGLIVVALAVLLFILANQKAALPSWIPGLGQDFYSINVEMETAQAVTPGQGQAAVIAGINVGKVGASTLDDGVAKVRLDIEPKYKDLIHSNAQFLLRPKTGLSDMVVEIDPGSKGPPPKEGSTIPISQSMSNVQMDQILASLDRDTQDYLVLLLNGAGEGLNGKGRELSQALRRFGPFTTYTARLNGALEKRRKYIARGVHAFSQVATELGNNDQAVADFISASKDSLGNYAAQEASLREALREFPSTLEAGRVNLAKSDQLSQLTRPTLLGLIPGARNLKGSLKSVQRLATETTPYVRDDIRPFTREVQPVFKELGKTSKASEKTTPNLQGTFTHLNTLLNMLAYNPPGDSEGFLFYAPWAAHNFNASVSFQDGAGLVRRSVNMLTCNVAHLAAGVFDANVQLETAYRLNQLPPEEAICP